MKIYIASKTIYAHEWVKLRNAGTNIISTWIDEAGKGESKDLADLCGRCIKESLDCDAMIVYSEVGDYLKGAFIEMGVALSVPGKPIYLVGPVLLSSSVFTYSPQVFQCTSIAEAIEQINQRLQNS